MTAYEMRISDWSSDVCSSDLRLPGPLGRGVRAVVLRGVLTEVPDVAVGVLGEPVVGVLDDLATRVGDAVVADRRGDTLSSEARRVGKESVSTCRSGWSSTT